MTIVLSRSADHLYWMSRLIERAENTARILDVSDRMGLLPAGSESASGGEWDAVLEITGDAANFHARFPEATAANVIAHMTLDPENPSSIYSLVRAARENARAERVGITTEMWEALNSTWLEIADLTPARITARGYRNFFDWIKERSHLFRGSSVATMLRDERYHFLRLGTFVERADNTARILDVKYHILLPDISDVGSAIDHFQWGALLRSVSAYRNYHHAYKQAITPVKVADLLIFNSAFPRSLHSCHNEIVVLLDEISGPRGGEAARQAGELHAMLHYGRIEAVFQHGLHEFLSDFINRNNRLSSEIQSAYLVAQ
jgi:uncharacterized alpha-E superfamily protein